MPTPLPLTKNHHNIYKAKSKFTIFLAIYFLIWIIAPTLLASSVPLDVSEGVNWGSEWQWGYYKHPPFSSWVLYSFYALFGHLGVYLLSQLTVLLTLLLVYVLTTKLWSKTTAYLAVLFTLLILYYGYPSLEFNHNVAQFPIWIGLCLCFYNAVTRQRLSDWLWVGVIGGIGMLTKYSVIFLLLPMALYLIYPKHWQLLKSPYPWLSALVMLAIFSPHLYWLMQHDWLPLTYAQGRTHEATATASAISSHFKFVGFSLTQVLAHLPLLVVLLLNRRHLLSINTYKQQCDQPQYLLYYLWLAPLVVLVALNLLLGIGLRDMWGMPMWGLSGILAVSWLVPSSKVLQRVSKMVMIWLSVVTILMMVYISYGQQLRDKPSRMDWSEQALAKQAQQTWASVSSCPLDNVSGDRWLTALVAMNQPKPIPSQMISGPASHSPWMSLERLQQHGTLVMWLSEDTVSLPLLETLNTQNQKTAFITHQGQWHIPWAKSADAAPLVVNWIAYVPSDCVVAEQ